MGNEPDRSQDGPADAPIWTPTGQSTAAYLEDLTRALITAVTAGSDPHSAALMRKHTHPNFRIDNTRMHDSLIPGAQGFEETVEATKQLMQQSGMSFQIEVLNVTADVSRGTRSARVYLTVRETTTRHGQRMMRESCCLLHWERRQHDGVWLVYRHASLRAGAGVW